MANYPFAIAHLWQMIFHSRLFDEKFLGLPGLGIPTVTAEKNPPLFMGTLQQFNYGSSPNRQTLAEGIWFMSRFLGWFLGDPTIFIQLVSLLVGGLVNIFYFPMNIGLLSSSQVTNSIIFQDGVGIQPPSRRFWWQSPSPSLKNPPTSLDFGVWSDLPSICFMKTRSQGLIIGLQSRFVADGPYEELYVADDFGLFWGYIGSHMGISL